MRIDAHQHFWQYHPEQYPWIQPGWNIQRDFLPHDLAPSLQQHGLDGCIAVQARQALAETRWLLELAKASPFIRGVVGWVDLRSPSLEQQLATFSKLPKLVGVRHVVQDEPDPNFMLRKEFKAGIARLSDFDLCYDILVFPHQLPAAIELARTFPQQRFVLDHLAKPPVRDQILSPWAEQIQELARSANVMCKLSGLVTEAKWQAWQPDDFTPYFKVVFDAFGPDRLMYGSDWPVALLAADYDRVFRLVSDYVEPFGEDVCQKIFGLNAQRFYHL